MASVLLLAGLAGAGIYFNKDGPVNRPSRLEIDKVPANEKPSGEDVYDSYRYLKARDVTQQKADDFFVKGFNAEETNIIPTNYNQVFSKTVRNLENPERTTLPSEKIRETIARKEQKLQESQEKKSFVDVLKDGLNTVFNQQKEEQKDIKRMADNQYNVYNKGSLLLGPYEEVNPRNVAEGFGPMTGGQALKNDWIRKNSVTDLQYSQIPNELNAPFDTIGVPRQLGNTGLISGQFRPEDYAKFGVLQPNMNPKVQSVPNWQILQQNQASNNSNTNGVEGFNPTISGPQKNPDAPFHNNMVPFFKGHRTQNIHRPHNEILESFTGQVPESSQFRMVHKREVERNDFFKPVFGLTHPYGMPSLGNFGRDRYIASQFKTNILPTNQIRVGRGLNQPGYGWKPADGYHSKYRPPQYNVDDLRTANNPKLTYRGRVLRGKEEATGRRGFIGKFFKHQPDTFYVNSPARYFTSTVSDSLKPKMETPANYKTDFGVTQRQLTTQSYGGIKGPTGRDKRQSYEAFYNQRAPHRASFRQIAPSNVGTEQLGPGHKDDYGRSGRFPVNPNGENYFNDSNEVHQFTEEGYWSKPQERDTTEFPRGNIRLGPHTKQIERGTMKLFDKQKQTKRNTIGNANREGTIFTKASERGTMKLFDRAKTTKTETLAHWRRPGAVESKVLEAPQMRLFDRAKTTKADTLPSYHREGAIGTKQNERFTTRPYDQQKITKRNTISSWRRFGGAGTAQTTTFRDRQAEENMEHTSFKESTLRGRRPTKQSVKNSIGMDAINISIRDRDLYDKNKRDQDAMKGGVNPGTRQFITIPDKFQQGKEGRTMNRVQSEGIRQPNEWLVQEFRKNPYSQSLSSHTPY